MNHMRKHSVESQLNETMIRIRNPEARTQFSDCILALSKEFYQTAILENQSLQQLFNQEEVMIMIEGSVLRGVSTPHTHDIDLAIFIKDQQKMRKLLFSVHDLQVGSEKYGQWITRQLSIRFPDLYQAMINEYERRYGQKPTKELLGVDSDVFDPQSLDIFLQKGSLKSLKAKEKAHQIRQVVQILTSDERFILFGENHLEKYKQPIINKLDAALMDTNNQEQLASIKADLNFAFVNMHRSTGYRYPLRDVYASLDLYRRRMKLPDADFFELQRLVLENYSKKIIIMILDTYQKYYPDIYNKLQDSHRDILPPNHPNYILRHLRTTEGFSGNTLPISEIRKIIDQHVAGEIDFDSMTESSLSRKFMRWKKLMEAVRNKINPFRD